MDYKKIYFQLIEKARTRGSDKKELPYYTESHHIVLRSLGGSDDPDNLVLLTAREHFVAHKLLWYSDKSCVQYQRAVWIMSSGKNLTSRQCDKLRTSYAAKMIGEGNPFYGKSHTEEAKRRTGAASRGRTQSAESREKTRQANLGAKRSPEAVQNMKAACARKDLSPWNVSGVKSSEYRTNIWFNAQHFFDFWALYGKPGARRLVKLYNHFYNDSVKWHTLITMVKKFEDGFIPSEDKSWINFYKKHLNKA